MPLSSSETTQDGKLTETRADLASSRTNRTTGHSKDTVDRNFRKVMTTRLKLARVLIKECNAILADPGYASELIPLSPSPHVVSRKLRQRTCTSKPQRGDPITDEWRKARNLAKKRENTFSKYRVKTEKRLKENNALLSSGIEWRDAKIQQEQNLFNEALNDNLNLSHQKRSIEDKHAQERQKMRKERIALQDWHTKELLIKERTIIDSRAENWRLKNTITEMNKEISEGRSQEYEQQTSRRSSLASSISSKFKTFRRKNKDSKAVEQDAESLSSRSIEPSIHQI